MLLSQLLSSALSSAAYELADLEKMPETVSFSTCRKGCYDGTVGEKK